MCWQMLLRSWKVLVRIQCVINYQDSTHDLGSPVVVTVALRSSCVIVCNEGVCGWALSTPFPRFWNEWYFLLWYLTSKIPVHVQCLFPNIIPVCYLVRLGCDCLVGFLTRCQVCQFSCGCGCPDQDYCDHAASQSACWGCIPGRCRHLQVRPPPPFVLIFSQAFAIEYMPQMTHAWFWDLEWCIEWNRRVQGKIEIIVLDFVHVPVC